MSRNNTNSNGSESPTYIWLDKNICNEENKTTRELLEGTLGNLTALNDIQECERFFGRNKHTHRLILIISGQLGKEFIPTIHEYSSVLSIYIYCENIKFHKEWSAQYTKVKSVVRTLDDLVSQILSD